MTPSDATAAIVGAIRRASRVLGASAYARKTVLRRSPYDGGSGSGCTGRAVKDRLRRRVSRASAAKRASADRTPADRFSELTAARAAVAASRRGPDVPPPALGYAIRTGGPIGGGAARGVAHGDVARLFCDSARNPQPKPHVSALRQKWAVRATGADAGVRRQRQSR